MPKPVVINAADLSSTDMGHGYRLVFQRSTKDPKQVRAVVKAPDGSVYASGDVVDESNAFHSRIQALSNSKKRIYCTSLGLGPEATEEEQKEALLKKVERDFGPLPPNVRNIW